MSIDTIIKNKFLRTHLKYVENTESPRIMHVWSAIMAASAAMGRHVWLEVGIKKTYSNNFCLLVGPPGTRKNTAINLAVDLMEKHTKVKFAPDDTGGQRQGLIVAIQHSDDNKLKDLTQGLFDLDNFATNDTQSLKSVKLDLQGSDPDRHAMFIKATEFGSFLGQGSVDMTRFLIKMWDCETYKYALKKEELVLKDPLVNLLGGTTSSDLALLLPSEAIGQGFMSRIILVYAPKKEKFVPPSKILLGDEHKPYLISIYKYLFEDLKGAMTKSLEAQEMEDDIYMQNIRLQDSRFIHYSERRGDHLMKLAMVLAATSKRTIITGEDFEEANALLIETEIYMSEALGEYGLSPLAQSRQKILEFIQTINGPVTLDILWYTLKRDMRRVDFMNCLQELVRDKKIIPIETSDGSAFVFKEVSDTLETLELFEA